MRQNKGEHTNKQGTDQCACPQEVQSRLCTSQIFFVFNLSTQFLPTCLLPQRESCQSWIPITQTVMMLCLSSFSLNLTHTHKQVFLVEKSNAVTLPMDALF